MRHFWPCIVLLFLASASSGQETRLPEPSGAYSVGVEYFQFTDSSRQELFDDSGSSFREMTVKAWYPSDIRTGKQTPCFLDTELAISGFQFPEIYSALYTNARQAVPMSGQESRYPVLIFSHGWGEHFAQNTLLMEELASHGYTVFSSAFWECPWEALPLPNSARTAR